MGDRRGTLRKTVDKHHCGNRKPTKSLKVAILGHLGSPSNESL